MAPSRVVTVVSLVLLACGRRPALRDVEAPSDARSFWDGSEPGLCFVDRARERFRPTKDACAAPRREVRTWGPVPREGPPAALCPMRARPVGDGVVAEATTFESAFDPLPFDECVPAELATGSRRVIQVEDGFLVAYDGRFSGVTFWVSPSGADRRTISRARVVGFARAPSGTVLGLAIGPARLGRGGVVAFDRAGPGEYTPRLVASLPLEPAPVMLDDGGAIVGFAQGFLFRADETGAVANVHYVARELGRISSIAKSDRGVYFLGLECGILRLYPDGLGDDGERYGEAWWSARSGASGRWASCVGEAW